MRTWRWGAILGALAAAAMIGLASCGDDDNNGGAAPPPQQISPDPLTLDIQAATVPDFATTARPTVTFRVLDKSGNPIDLEAELASTTVPNFSSPGRVPSFALAMLDDNNDYVSYYSTTRAPGAYTYIVDPEVIGTDATFAPPIGSYDPSTGRVTFGAGAATRTQATAVAVAKGPNLAAVGSRVYRFTFPAPPSTTGLDRTKTHTVAGWLVRRPSTSDTDIAADALNFVPSGNAAVQNFQTITNDGCNRCHGALTAHGTRRDVRFCITCHSPQTTDPETDRTVDFKVMIHKIHYGSSLPSVRQGKPYYIVGFGQGPVDFSDVSFPWHEHGVQHCTVCHQGEDANNWRTNPVPKACISCHDNVQFTSAAGLPSCASLPASARFENCMHDGGQIAITNPNSPTACQGCHGAGAASATDKFHHGD